MDTDRPSKLTMYVAINDPFCIWACQSRWGQGKEQHRQQEPKAPVRGEESRTFHVQRPSRPCHDSTSDWMDSWREN